MPDVNIALLAYIGPETVVPLASALAAIAGGIMMGWRYIIRFSRKVVRLIIRR